MRLNSLQYLRGIAALAVVHFHAVSQVPAYFEFLVVTGQGGVDLFFVISGAVMVLAAREHDSAMGFAARRVLRIVPLYLVIFLVATSIGRDKFAPQDLLYLFVSNLGLAPTSGTVITGAAWTISLEFLFYMVFPFLARFTIERGLAYLGGWLVLMAFFKVAALAAPANFSMTTTKT